MHLRRDVLGLLIPEAQRRCAKTCIIRQRFTAHDVTPRIQRGGNGREAETACHDVDFRVFVKVSVWVNGGTDLVPM